MHNIAHSSQGQISRQLKACSLFIFVPTTYLSCHLSHSLPSSKNTAVSGATAACIMAFFPTRLGKVSLIIKYIFK